MPALLWASIYAIIMGPWETIVYTFEHGFSSEKYTEYVWMQIRAMFWGPIQLVYYLYRGAVFILLIPWNFFVVLLDLMYIPYILWNWFLYYMKFIGWFIHLAYIISNHWNNHPSDFIQGFIYLVQNSSIGWDLLFFWFWLPIYFWIWNWQWIFSDIFEERPSLDAIKDLLRYSYDYLE